MRLPHLRFTIRRLMIAVATSGAILAVFPRLGFSNAQALLIGSGLSLGVLCENGNGGRLHLTGTASGMAALGASAWFDRSTQAAGATGFLVLVILYTMAGAAFGAVMSLLPWSLVQRFDPPEPVTDGVTGGTDSSTP